MKHSFAIAYSTHRLPSQHTQTFVCPQEGPHRDRLKAGTPEGTIPRETAGETVMGCKTTDGERATQVL